MRIGVITDEVSQDFEEAMRFCAEHGLECAELRSAWEKGPFDFSEEDILKIKEISDRYKIPISAISTPVFKCEYNEENICRHTEGLLRMVKYAKILGADKLRCFNFLKSENVSDEMVWQAFCRGYAECGAAGITIMIESEPTTNARACRDIARLVRYVNKPYFKALYDPGNNIYSTDEVPFPEGYEEIQDSLCHIHIKDAVRINGTAVGVAVGDGAVDYAGLFRRLFADGYSGDVMLETHYRPRAALSEETLKNPKGSAISENGYEASRECIIKLKKIIESAKNGRDDL